MRALVIGNGPDFDPGFVGQRFREHGYVFEELHRERPEAWPHLDGAELVLTLGSEWNVYDPARSDAVEAEAAYTRDVVDAGVPLFAICYGAQLLAHALGAPVERIPEPEIGWVDITLVDPSSPAIANGPWMQWHYDGFEVPDGFRELARTDAGPQLIVRDRIVATQFHPEATATVVARWLRMGGAEQYRQWGGEPAELLAQTHSNVERSRPHAESLVDWFLGTDSPDQASPGWEGNHETW